MINGIMIGIPLTKKVKGKPDKLTMPIAHYSAAGKTNSDSDRAILKDLTGNGHDLTLLNFAFTSQSGYNNNTLVFDGVDDYGVNNNFPQLKKFTIIYKRSVSRDIIRTAPLFSKKNENITGEFVTENISDYNEERNDISVSNQTYNIEIINRIKLNSTEADTFFNTNTVVHKGNISNGNKNALSNILLIGKFAEKEWFTTTFKGVFYEAYIFDKELTDEQISYYKELMFTKPIAHWSAKGKTNNDSDRGVLKDLSGNGRDIKLNNFAYTATSGYDGDGGLVFDGVDDYGMNENMPIMTDYTVIAKRKNTGKLNSTLLSKSSSLGKGAFIIELYDSGGHAIINFGNRTTLYDFDKNLIMYQTPNFYNSTPIKKGNVDDEKVIFLGCIRLNDIRIFQGIFYECYLFNKTLSEEEINYYKSLM